MKTILISCTAIALLSACASPQQPGQQDKPEQSFGASITEKINASVAAVNNSLHASTKRGNEKNTGADASSGGRTRLRDSGLIDVIGNSTSDKWPRVAVTINKLPKWFYSTPPSGLPGGYSPRDCINVSITLWRDQKTSKTYDNLDICGNDIIANTPFKDIGLMWVNFATVRGSQHTGAQRTRGPLPPQRLFPNKPGLDMFFSLNGAYYVGSIMATVGYNWKEPQDARFWIVNVPTEAEVARQ